MKGRYLLWWSHELDTVSNHSISVGFALSIGWVEGLDKL